MGRVNGESFNGQSAIGRMFAGPAPVFCRSIVGKNSTSAGLVRLISKTHIAQISIVDLLKKLLKRIKPTAASLH